MSCAMIKCALCQVSGLLAMGLEDFNVGLIPYGDLFATRIIWQTETRETKRECPTTSSCVQTYIKDGGRVPWDF